MLKTIGPVIIASFFLVGFLGLFEKPDAVRPEEIALPDSLKGVAICYEEHVAPLFRKKCTPCHTEKATEGIYLNSYKGCRKALNDVLYMTVKGKMPPGERPKMNGNEIAVLRAWKEGGFKDCPAAK